MLPPDGIVAQRTANAVAREYRSDVRRELERSHDGGQLMLVPGAQVHGVLGDDRVVGERRKHIADRRDGASMCGKAVVRHHDHVRGRVHASGVQSGDHARDRARIRMSHSELQDLRALGARLTASQGRELQPLELDIRECTQEGEALVAEQRSRAPAHGGCV